LKASEEVKKDADHETQSLIDEYQTKIVSDYTDGIKGKIISKTLDNLSKEIIRWKQEKKLQLWSKLQREKEDYERQKNQAEDRPRKSCAEGKTSFSKKLWG